MLERRSALRASGIPASRSYMAATTLPRNRQAQPFLEDQRTTGISRANLSEKNRANANRSHQPRLRSVPFESDLLGAQYTQQAHPQRCSETAAILLTSIPSSVLRE